ncbi:HAAS signaling domain-containing protein [Streptomyces sp. NPDC057689]|uniref:HAAS signaling domain-containing protein n=1 Tax=Streptomyces sp. NPDC057689 TaxID=3346213 RepID=UPI0036864913
MKTTDDTLVHDYLATVERESAALPPAARQELMADLNEHIEVARAERPGDIRTILREMGDPRTIAGTALLELGATPGSPAPRPNRRRSPAWVPLALLLTGSVVAYAGEHVLLSWLSLAMRITAVVMVCRSSHWIPARKWTGLAVAVVLPVLMNVVWYLAVVAPGNDDVIDAWRLPGALAGILLTVAGVAWLWRTRQDRARVRS